MRTAGARRRAWWRSRSSSSGVLVVCGAVCLALLTVPATPADALPGLKIADFSASPSTVKTTNGYVEITATVKKAASCTLSAVPPVPGLPMTGVCSFLPFQTVLPRNTGTESLDYRFTLAAIGPRGHASADLTVTVKPGAGGLPDPLSSVSGVTSDENGACALTSSTGVDCWGVGSAGQLGNGAFDTSAVSVPVVGVGDTGLLSGVVSLTANGLDYCALMSSTGVDCWGSGDSGQLGNAAFTDSDVPVQVAGVGGTGTLSGVVGLSADPYGYCAVTSSSTVDCWGDGYDGELGDGMFHTTGHDGSAVPVQVVGVGGMGTLGGVVTLISDDFAFCALMSSTRVDCWGEGTDGQLGNRVLKSSAVPVMVVGLSGTGTLKGVASLIGSGRVGETVCALMSSTGVDCWGDGTDGELGNGVFEYSSLPVQVVTVGDTGTLSGSVALTSDGGGFCVLTSATEVECWGIGNFGELGDGVFYTSGNFGSAVPVQVLGVGGTGTLTGVSRLTSDGSGYCALMSSSGVDCWGGGYDGELGDGVFYTSGNFGSAVPVQVLGVGGSGTLTGVSGLTLNLEGENYCALMGSSGVNCRGYGTSGALGDGYPTNSAVPVPVVGVAVRTRSRT